MRCRTRRVRVHKTEIENDSNGSWPICSTSCYYGLLIRFVQDEMVPQSDITRSPCVVTFSSAESCAMYAVRVQLIQAAPFSLKMSTTEVVPSTSEYIRVKREVKLPCQLANELAHLR